MSTKFSFRQHEDSQHGNENLPRSVCLCRRGSLWGQKCTMRQDWPLLCCIQNTCWQVLSPPCCEVGALPVLSAAREALIIQAWYLQQHTQSIVLLQICFYLHLYSVPTFLDLELHFCFVSPNFLQILVWRLQKVYFSCRVFWHSKTSYCFVTFQDVSKAEGYSSPFTIRFCNNAQLSLCLCTFSYNPWQWTVVVTL